MDIVITFDSLPSNGKSFRLDPTLRKRVDLHLGNINTPVLLKDISIGQTRESASVSLELMAVLDNVYLEDILTSFYPEIK